MFPPESLIPPQLIRVEIPDHPEAITTSHNGSLLSEPPPSGTKWRYEEFAVIDRMPSQGSIVDIDLLSTIGATTWHEAGFYGQNTKIAVIDLEWYGKEWMEAELGNFTSHDCFTHPSCEIPIDPLSPQYLYEQGRHGIACAEMIHDIAPAAELHLVRASSLTSLENAVAWAIRNEIDVISMSLSFFNDSFYDGHGPHARLMSQLKAANILLVTSAGNFARQHYSDTFRDLNFDSIHDYPHGSEFLPIYFKEGERRVNVIWDEFRNCGIHDLDAYLWTRNGILAGRSTSRQTIDADNCSPVERLKAFIQEEDWHFLQVVNHRGPADVQFDVMARGGTMYFVQPEGSIVDPGNHPSAYTVGAIPLEDYLVSPVAHFSSQGAAYFDVLKPDISAPSGLTTSSFGFTNFTGTSASTPVVAGALALVLSRYPEKTPYDAADYLSQSAFIGPFEQRLHSRQIGHGRLRLPSLEEHSGCNGNALFLPFVLYGYRRRKSIRQAP